MTASKLLRSVVSRSLRVKTTQVFPRQTGNAASVVLSSSTTTTRTAATATPDSNSLRVPLEDPCEAYPILSLPLQYLREMDASNFDAVTSQRTNVSFDPHDGKPSDVTTTSTSSSSSSPAIHDCSLLQGDVYRIEWKDGLVSEFSNQWVQEQLSSWKGTAISTTTTDSEDRVPWTTGIMTEESLRASSALSMNFNDALSDTGMRQALAALYQYGILLVKKTPVDDNGAGVAALASALGGGAVKKNPATCIVSNYLSGQPDIMLPRGTDGPLRTLYGTVWSTTSSGQAQGASVADSAYGHEGLPLHTDMTYFRDPPGLQIFTMVHPAAHGGESIFGDGLAAAERLRATNPEAFATLSQTVRRYRCVDTETGWHLQGSGPVISVENAKVIGIRHNDLDRLPDLPPPAATKDEVHEFYHKLQVAHEVWDDILGQDETRLAVSLNPGDTMVVANQRCFHGRHSFQASDKSPRSVMGCYVSQDELNSRFRLEGFDAR